MRKLFSVRALLACCLLVSSLLTIPGASAQQTLGSLNGTVTDVSGASLSGATITVVSEQTGLTRSTKAQRNGYWEILNLPVGSYRVRVQQENFQTTEFPGIAVSESRATTINASLKPGQVSESVTVSANPLLNATDTTNGYTLDKTQIMQTPLATGSFTQLAIMAPGVSSQLLSGIGTDAGLGNQPIWSNGQRATSNTFTVNGVDVTNLFNGQSSSQDESQRYQFNIGEGASTGGQYQDNISVYGSNGNGLASPPPEFMQEIAVTTSMYDAEQGQTSGAHVDINTSSGTNAYHGQIYAQLGNNFMNADPFFYKQDVLLGTLPAYEEDPQLHRWVTGATLGGPIVKNKLFFFLGYQHLYDSDQTGALSQFQVPSGLTDDRSSTGISNALCSYYAATSGYSSASQNCASNGTQNYPSSKWNSAAVGLLNAKLPNGNFLIPSADANAQSQLENKQPDVTIVGTSVFKGDQADATMDFNATGSDHLSAKYFYQHMPTVSPFASSNTEGFPENEDTGAQVASLTNSIMLGPRINWAQQVGFSRQKVYSDFSTALQASDVGISAPGNNFPGLEVVDFAEDNSNSLTGKVGPSNTDNFFDQGYFENRLSPSSTVIFSLGKHTVSVGFNYGYNQLNIENNVENHSQLETKTFTSFLTGKLAEGTVLEGSSNRYYRSNDAGAFAMDKWQILPNVSITAGVRYDLDGPFSEKNGALFNFDPALFSATDSAVTNTGFIVAGNNKQYGTSGVSDSTLKGRQWGIAPRIGVAWSPKQFNGKVVWRAGAGIYYDRGEYFQYLSPPAGSGISGPFGVTQEAPFAAFTDATGKLNAPFPTIVPPTTPATLAATMPTIDSMESACTAANEYQGNDLAGYNCNDGVPDGPLVIGNYGINNVLPYTEDWMLDMQWQPRNDMSIDLGYVGNRGKHAVIPIPFNEPGIATTSHPINGQTYSYGLQVLSPTATDAYGNPLPMANEPYDTFSGGNTDMRVPYVGYDPNSTTFETVGISAYDALQAQLTKRMSHGVQIGASYTWSHTLDEQSDLGLFFTGDNPDDLRSSYTDADFDQTNTLSINFILRVPNAVRDRHNWASYFTNDWSLLGIASLDSGQPYSIYDYSGSVGSEYFGGNIELVNPVLPIKPGLRPSQVKTGHSGAYTYGSPNGNGGVTSNYVPALNADDFYIPLVAQGVNGVPPCDTTTAGGNAGPGGGPLCDVFETDFVPGQRNIFRQSFQKQANVALQKDVHITERWDLNYQFEVFNVTNTPSFDVPTNEITLNPNYDEISYVNGQIEGEYGYGHQVQPGPSNSVTTPSGTASCQGASTNCAYELYTVPGAKSNKLGVVTDTIGSQRLVEMSMHLTF
ncbi:MAG: carboxypeptidase regulatory-like domain-containing protein [Acidobacteriaceae bacterium]